MTAQPQDGLTDTTSVRGRGMAVRRAVLGDDHVDHATATATEFTAPFQEYVTEAVWGAVWARDGIDRRTRSVVTLAVLTALRCHDELELHVRAALRNGLTSAEIGEVLLHVGAYAGVPAARTAFGIAQRVLEDQRPVEDQRP